VACVAPYCRDATGGVYQAVASVARAEGYACACWRTGLVSGRSSVQSTLVRIVTWAEPEKDTGVVYL